MDQKKIGDFLKSLRKERGITQEQLAETFGVSARTVSRWETGANMPDLALLVQIAEFYNVELEEILDGERKDETMDEKMKSTVLKVADYSNQEKKQLQKRVCWLLALGVVAFTIHVVLELSGVPDTSFGGHVSGFTMGMSYVMLIFGLIYASGWLDKIVAAKKKLFKL